MPTLQVLHAEIHFESFGSGPLLLFIAGAHGRGGVFHEAAVLLARNYTVVCWDRRGYSRSLLRGPQDMANRLLTDADDAHLLIQHLSTEPALVFGSSAGAIVAQNLLIRHPESVRTVVVHEPPSLSILPDEFRSKAKGRIQRTYDTYRTSGPSAAMDVFVEGAYEGEDGQVLLHTMDVTRSNEIWANFLLSFEFELRQYTSSPLDIERIVAEKVKFVPAAGIESENRNGIIPITIIAGLLQKDLCLLPGGHLPYITVPEEFSVALHDLFTKS